MCVYMHVSTCICMKNNQQKIHVLKDRNMHYCKMLLIPFYSDIEGSTAGQRPTYTLASVTAE